MEENPSFWDKNKNFIIAGVIVLVAIAFIANQRKNSNDNEQREDQATEESSGNINGDGVTDKNENKDTMSKDSSTTMTKDAKPVTGNVSATGKLKVSDNLEKGNLMLESNRGTVYIQTGRDYSAWIEKDVTLNAEGDINSFRFLGFAEVNPTIAAVDTTAKGGSSDSDSMLSVSGRLEKSDDTAKGNYIIHSDAGKIYLKSVHNYDAWSGSEVILSATGTINSFTGAVLHQK